MSEVYIRSQNKEKLYRLGGNYACVEYGEYEDVKKKRGGAEADKKRHVICISDGCLEEIGEYSQGETEVTIPLNTYIAMLKTRGGAELENYGKNINFVSTINTNSNLKFKADFDLGDRITCKETKWGIQIDARITEVTETYQKGEETIEATFGDSLPTLVDQIRKVR